MIETTPIKLPVSARYNDAIKFQINFWGKKTKKCQSLTNASHAILPTNLESQNLRKTFKGKLSNDLRTL